MTKVGTFRLLPFVAGTFCRNKIDSNVLTKWDETFQRSFYAESPHYIGFFSAQLERSYQKVCSKILFRERSDSFFKRSNWKWQKSERSWSLIFTLKSGRVAWFIVEIGDKIAISTGFRFFFDPCTSRNRKITGLSPISLLSTIYATVRVFDFQKKIILQRSCIDRKFLIFFTKYFLYSRWSN